MCHTHYERWRRTGEAGPAQLQRVRAYPPDAECSVPGCSRRPRVDWLCNMHMRRPDATDPDALRVRAYDDNDECLAPGCHERPRAKGLCRLHYQRTQTNGTLATVGKLRCQVCAHPDVLLIEEKYDTHRRWDRRKPLVEEYGLSPDALTRHMREHRTEERAALLARQELTRLRDLLASDL